MKLASHPQDNAAPARSCWELSFLILISTALLFVTFTVLFLSLLSFSLDELIGKRRQPRKLDPFIFAQRFG